MGIAFPSSSLVPELMPEHLRVQGPLTVAFLQAYYEWLENSNALYSISKIEGATDIDSTLEVFLEFFKNTYLNGIRLSSNVDIRKLIKHNRELYDSKGTTNGLKLLFALLYEQDAEVFYPSTQIIKPSSGKWFEPTYIELSISDDNFDLVDRRIVGSTTGASAVVEAVVRRNVSGKQIDVVYLSSLVGSFRYQEKVLCPQLLGYSLATIVGSFSDFVITDGGRNFQVGDLLEIDSTSVGKDGLLRVTNVFNGTGRTEFDVVDGGFGYTSNAEVTIAERMFEYQPVSNTSPLVPGEVVIQDLYEIDYLSANGNVAVGQTLNSYTSGTWIAQATGTVVSTSNSQVLVQKTSGSDFRLADTIASAGNTFMALIDEARYTPSKSVLVQANTSWLGVADLTRDVTFIANTSLLRTERSNNLLRLVSRADGFGASFAVGSLTNREQTVIMPDRLNSLNNNNISYLDVSLSGAGSGVGFIEKVSIGKTLTLNDVVGTFDVGDLISFSNSTSVLGTVECYFANSTHIKVFEKAGTLTVGNSLKSYKATANSVATIVLNQGSSYSNTTPLVFTGGGGSVSNVSVITGGTGYANGQQLIFTGECGQPAIGVIQTNGSGQIVSTSVPYGGQAYRNEPIVTIQGSGSGAVLKAVLSNSNQATGSITTNGSGAIVATTVATVGSGYFSRPLVAPSGGLGSGAELFAVVDYGYGLPKDVNGDGSSAFDTILRRINTQVGTIFSLTRVSPGQQYNVAPFVDVVEPAVLSLSRYDLVLNVSNVQGNFQEGEDIFQEITTPVVELDVSNAGFQVGELVTQVATGATGIVSYSDATLLVLDNTTGTFNTSNVQGLASGTSASVTLVTPTTTIRSSKGVVRKVEPNRIWVRRLSLNTSFAANIPVTSFTGSSATVTSIEEDRDLGPAGDNEIISSTVVVASGIVTEVEVVASGIGYQHEEEVTASKSNSSSSMKGRIIVQDVGKGLGYWEDQTGFVSGTDRIYDGEFYQQFSYLIRTGLSIEKYRDAVEKLAHQAGTKMFGQLEAVTYERLNVEGSSSLVSV